MGEWGEGRTVTDAEGEVLLAPAAGDGVKVAAADAAGFDLDVDIVVFEWLGLVILLCEVELLSRCGAGDLESAESVWVNHCEG